MPSFAESQVALIDSRIAAATRPITKFGTVAGRDGTGYGARVVFDGSSGTAQPVKCPESVVVDEGDRVGLVEYQGEWLITINYAHRSLAHAQEQFTWSGNLTTTSATYVDMPNSPALLYVKRRDLTTIRFEVGVSMYSTATSTVSQIGLRVTSPDLVTDYDLDVRRSQFDVANTHLFVGGFVDTATQHPAGTYTATARWYRLSGTGTLIVNNSDYLTIKAREEWE